MAILRPESYHRIVALSALADHPIYSNISKLPAHLDRSGIKVQSSKSTVPVCNENIEVMLSLKPDLVLLAAYSSPLLARQLTQAQIPVFSAVSPRSLDDIGTTIKTLGEALGEGAQSDLLYKDFLSERARIKNIAFPTTLSKRRIIHIFADGAVSGSQTLFDSLATELSIVNQAAVHGLVGWSKHSIETLLALNPEIIITGKEDHESQQAVVERIKKIPGFGRLPALISTRETTRETTPDKTNGTEKGQDQGPVIALPERELGSVSHHILSGLAKLKQALISREQQWITPRLR